VFGLTMGRRPLRIQYYSGHWLLTSPPDSGSQAWLDIERSIDLALNSNHAIIIVGDFNNNQLNNNTNNKICIHKIVFPRKLYFYRLSFVTIFQLYHDGPFKSLIIYSMQNRNQLEIKF
jgi:hypothetical protein